MSELYYSVVRSKRRTVVISVSEGKVTVRAPLRTADEAIARFVAEKEEWIRKKQREQSHDAFREVIEAKALLDAGRQKPVFYGSSRNEEREGVFYLKSEGAVRRYFEKTRCWILAENLNILSSRCGLVPADVTVRDFKARWGCCDEKGRICLNWRLVMLPPELCEYVLIHELCHLSVMNHSAAFWEKVANFCPDYRIRKRRLKDYAFLTRMYR